MQIKFIMDLNCIGRVWREISTRSINKYSRINCKNKIYFFVHVLIYWEGRKLNGWNCFGLFNILLAMQKEKKKNSIDEWKKWEIFPFSFIAQKILKVLIMLLCAVIVIVVSHYKMDLYVPGWFFPSEFFPAYYVMAIQ